MYVSIITRSSLDTFLIKILSKHWDEKANIIKRCDHIPRLVAEQSRADAEAFFDITTTKAPECAEYQWSSHSQSRRISLRALCSVGCGGVLFTQQYLCCTTYCCCHAYSHQRQRLTAQRQQHQALFLADKKRISLFTPDCREIFRGPSHAKSHISILYALTH